MLGGTAHPKASGLEVVECTGDIGNLRDRQMHDGAGGSLVAANGHAGSALVGNDDTGRAHNLGGAHDGAKVAVVGHMVEHNDERRTVARTVEDIGNISIGEVTNLERNALVSAMTRQRIELRARHILNADARGVEVVDQARQGGIALPALSDERALDGKAGTQRLGGGTATFDKLALGNLDSIAVAIALRTCGLGTIALALGSGSAVVAATRTRARSSLLASTRCTLAIVGHKTASLNR